MGETTNWRERLVAAGVAAPSLADAALCAAMAKDEPAVPDAALGPVSGAAIRALLLGAEGLPPLPPAGLRLLGARVAGEVDLMFGGSREAPLPPLVLRGCQGAAEGEGLVLRLADASLRALSLWQSVLARLDGNRLHVLGETTLQAVTLLPGGTISLIRAELAGALDVNEADLGWGKQAGAWRQDPPAGGTVLQCAEARIGSSVYLRQSHAAGMLDFRGANIGGDLDANDAVLRAPGAEALNADRASVAGGVFLRRLAAEGALRFLGARIGGDLALVGAQLRQPEGTALHCDGMRLGGDLFLRPDRQRSRVQGQIRLLGAEIGGVLSLLGAELRGPAGQPALQAENARIGGALLAYPAAGQPCEIQGGLHAIGARIGFGVNLRDAVLTPHAEAPDAPVLNLIHASIDQRLDVPGLGAGSRGVVDLCHASVTLLEDQDGLAWGAADQGEPRRVDGHLTGLKLVLDGFTYQRIEPPKGPAATRWQGREAFLKRQFEGTRPKPGDFRPQPWEQLVKVLRVMGYPQDADDFARKKRGFAIQCRAERWGARTWNRFVGATTGHYYSVPRAACIMALYVALGAVLLGAANGSDNLRKHRSEVDLARPSLSLLRPFPSHPAPTPDGPQDWTLLARADACWDALGWGSAAEAAGSALDMALPLIDLHQDERCEVDDQAPARGAWAWVLLVYSVFGWVVTSLGIVTFSGLGRKE